MAKAETIALWMRSQLSAAGARGFVVGLSGGIDSAVVARLAQMAAPVAVLAVLLPCHSDPQDERDALLVASKLSLPTPRVELSAAYDALVAEAQAALRLVPEAMRALTAQDPSRSRLPLNYVPVLLTCRTRLAERFAARHASEFTALSEYQAPDLPPMPGELAVQKTFTEEWRGLGNDETTFIYTDAGFLTLHRDVWLRFSAAEAQGSTAF